MLHQKVASVHQKNTHHRGSITVHLVSSLPGLDLVVPVFTNNNILYSLVKSDEVYQEKNRTYSNPSPIHWLFSATHPTVAYFSTSRAVITHRGLVANELTTQLQYCDNSTSRVMIVLWFSLIFIVHVPGQDNGKQRLLNLIGVGLSTQEQQQHWTSQTHNYQINEKKFDLKNVKFCRCD